MIDLIRLYSGTDLENPGTAVSLDGETLKPGKDYLISVEFSEPVFGSSAELEAQAAEKLRSDVFASVSYVGEKEGTLQDAPDPSDPQADDQGLAKDYSGQGWYKALDTGVVYSRGVPDRETHVFAGDPKEYINVVMTEEDDAIRQFIIDNADVVSTSNVETMRGLFYGADAPNHPIDHFDTHNVKDMTGMFYGAAEFNQPVGHFDVSNVEPGNMNMMFYGNYIFNQDLSGWCVSQFSTKPEGFDTNTEAWTLPKPQWGTCPRGEDQA